MPDFNQRNSTRNQSTADITFGEIFLFDNRFQEGVFKNNTAASINISKGILVVRDTTVVNGLIPATTANLANVVGIADVDDLTLAASATANISFGTKGTVNETLLVLPATVTLDTAVGSITLRDTLEKLGFHLEATVEHTKFDN
jgi:hypothetical protein